MKLRQKTLLTVGLGLGLLILISTAIVSRISLRSFAALEAQDMTRNVSRARNALSNVLESLDTSVIDYSQWDDTYAFIAGEDADFTEINLDDYIHDAFDLDLVLFITTSGEPIYAKGYDFEAGQETELSERIRDLFKPESPLLFDPEDRESRTGILMLPAGPALYGSAPILTSRGDGPGRGTLIMARFLTDERLDELADQTRLSLSFETVAEASGSRSDGLIVPRDGDDPHLEVVDEDTVAGTTLIDDIDGRPALVLRVDSPRTIVQQGKATVRYLVVTLLLVSVFIGLLVLLFLERVVLSRLAHLSHSVRAIADEGNPTERIVLAGKDELGGLASDINTMLAALEQKNRELSRSNAELEQFAYTASHDLQEPLRKIQAFGDRLASKAGPALGEDGLLYLDRMKESASRMQRLIQDLLTYSRISTQGTTFRTVDLNQIAREVVSDLEVRIEQTGARVELGKLPSLDADPVQLRQVLQNLIGNALKFTRPGEPPVIEVLGRDMADGTIELVVQDNGIGFDEKYADRIFNMFQRLHGRSEYQGTGIGLAIVRKVVERHGGSIRVQSRPGEGATFIATLALRHNEPKHFTNGAESAEGRPSSGTAEAAFAS